MSAASAPDTANIDTLTGLKGVKGALLVSGLSGVSSTAQN
jgi:hypothetical protein